MAIDVSNLLDIGDPERDKLLEVKKRDSANLLMPCFFLGVTREATR